MKNLPVVIVKEEELERISPGEVVQDRTWWGKSCFCNDCHEEITLTQFHQCPPASHGRRTSRRRRTVAGGVKDRRLPGKTRRVIKKGTR